jgi:hypothetical protein
VFILTISVVKFLRTSRFRLTPASRILFSPSPTIDKVQLTKASGWSRYTAAADWSGHTALAASLQQHILEQEKEMCPVTTPQIGGRKGRHCFAAKGYDHTINAEKVGLSVRSLHTSQPKREALTLRN